jgi:ATP-dependent DNA helicase RecG
MPLPLPVQSTLSRLSALIDENRFEELETDTLELKPVPPTGGEWRERHKSVNAFLNTRGGILILGIKEEGQGAARRYVHTGWQAHGENGLRELPTKFTQRNGTPLDLHDAFPAPMIVPFRNGQVAVQLVDELAADRKYAFLDGVAYKRIVTADQKLTPSEIARQEEFREEALQARELQPVRGLTADDLSLDKLNAFIFQLNQPVQVETMKADLNQARPFLQRRSFLINGNVTTLGALVCANHPGDVLGFRAQAHCYVDAPNEIARDKQDFVDGVLQLMESSLGYLLRNTQVGISAHKGGVSTPEYPEALLRETVNNALAHRDYSINRQVIVAVKPGSHISIQNPGAFRSHLLIERDDDRIPLRRILPEAKPRNPKLADVLRVFRKWEGRGIGMATLVNLCLANRIDIPYYILGSDEVRLHLRPGMLLDERMVRLFSGFDRYIEDKLKGGQLSEQQKLVLAYLIKSEWANELNRYTILLTPDNNHYAELETLERARLIQRHSASTANHPIFVADRTLVRKDFVLELRQLFGAPFDALLPFQKQVLGVLYRQDRYSKSGAASAREVSFELWAEAERRDDLKAFDAFNREVRRAVNALEKAGLVHRKVGTRGFALLGQGAKDTRGVKPYKDLALAFFLTTRTHHAVDEVRQAIGLPDSTAGRNQARNILVRLGNERHLRRVEPGVYELARRREKKAK